MGQNLLCSASGHGRSRTLDVNSDHQFISRQEPHPLLFSFAATAAIFQSQALRKVWVQPPPRFQGRGPSKRRPTHPSSPAATPTDEDEPPHHNKQKASKSYISSQSYCVSLSPLRTSALSAVEPLCVLCAFAVPRKPTSTKLYCTNPKKQAPIQKNLNYFSDYQSVMAISLPP